VFKIAGGRPNFSVLVSVELDACKAIQLIQSRLPARVVNQAARFLHVEPLELTSALSIRRTLSRKSSNLNRPLSQAETERMVRLADITRRAVAAFGDSTAAAKWMCASNIALAGASPLAFVATDLGAREVRRVISAISHGAAL
jgi:putative toxin-antitoxin system antitoxin component (TIGR02293 family)